MPSIVPQIWHPLALAYWVAKREKHVSPKLVLMLMQGSGKEVTQDHLVISVVSGVPYGEKFGTNDGL